MFRVVKFKDTESRMVFTNRDRDKFNGYGVSVWEDKQILEMADCDTCIKM